MEKITILNILVILESIILLIISFILFFRLKDLSKLKKLQDDVNPNSYEDLNTVFFSQFNKNIEDKVKYINKKPLAAASIGQVYFAVLETGDKVIIKIQRPNIENTIRMDLDILRSIARLLDEYLNYSGISFIQIYEEFSNQILRELDYNFEARNCDKFREIHKNDYKIYIRSPEEAANAMICLINQTNQLLDQKLRWTRDKFIQEGGFRENLFKKRKNYLEKTKL